MKERRGIPLEFPPYPVISREVMFDGPYAFVEHQRVVLPNKKESDWYISGRSYQVASIIPLTPEGEILLIRCYKHGAGKTVWELPTGVVEEGENNLVGAKRELQEETGYGGGEWEKIGEYWSSPTNSASHTTVYTAKGVRKVSEQQLDEAEQISVHLFSGVDEFRQRIQETGEDVAGSLWSAFGVWGGEAKTHLTEKSKKERMPSLVIRNGKNCRSRR